MSGGASRRHSSFGFYVLSKTYVAISVINFLAFYGNSNNRVTKRKLAF
jgi:hypothetical protein